MFENIKTITKLDIWFVIIENMRMLKVFINELPLIIWGMLAEILFFTNASYNRIYYFKLYTISF